MFSFSRNKTAQSEPSFAERFQKLKMDLHRQLMEMLDLSQLDAVKPEQLKREIRALTRELTAETHELLSEPDRERLVEELQAEIFGLGPLEPLMKDPTISDILVNGPRQVFIERHGRLEQTALVFANDQHLMQIIQRIAAQVGRRADEMSPMVDARLPDGSRVNAIVPPLSLEGPVLSIRRFGIRLQSDDLLANGTMPMEILTLLKAAVEARISMLIAGGTGSGKTTLLNILSRYIPADERLVTIEDSAELKLQQPHVVRLETRPSNLEGVGQVSQRDLVRNSLRMRPDRIILGEVRGAEALDMLQAMNTGHEGSLTTIHANGSRDALARLEMMVMLAGFEIPVPVIRQYISSAITLVVHLSRLKGGVRKVMNVSELVGSRMRNIFRFKQTGVRDGVAIGEFHASGHMPRVCRRLHASGIDLSESLFAKRLLECPGTTVLEASVQSGPSAGRRDD
jgi:pilus assembly protein CpaF